MGEIVERVHLAQLAGVDQAHVHVADAGAVGGFIKQRILAMQDRLFQCSLADVVVQRSAGLAGEQREVLPTLEHVIDRRAQRGIRFDELFIELPLQPLV